MFKFLKSIFYNEKKDEENENLVKTSTSFKIIDSIKESLNEAEKYYAKPEEYNRTIYEDKNKLNIFKINAFKDETKVFDKYTEKKLVIDKKTAKELYGDEYRNHIAEVDHITPINMIFQKFKKNPWITNENIKKAVNDNENLVVTSGKFNNAKRDRTNEEFVNDEIYIKEKNISLTEDGKDKAISDGKRAENFIDKTVKKEALKDACNTVHNAGINSMINAGTFGLSISSIQNVTSFIKGDLSKEEAFENIASDTVKSGANAYVLGSSLTAFTHSLSSYDSKLIQLFVKNNVPAKIINTFVLTGKTLKSWINNEISTQECIFELGEKGINSITVLSSIMVGQTLIPISIIGATIGALVGSTIIGKYSNYLKEILRDKKINHQKYLQLIKEYEKAEKQAKAFKKELEEYLKSYFKEYQDCFDEALFDIRYSFQNGDANGVIAGANKITEKLGGKVKYNTVEEFKNFLKDDSIDTF